MTTHTTPVAPPPLARNRNFSLLWFGEGVSVLGNATTSVLLPLLAVVGFDAGPGWMGALTAAAWVPWLLIGLPAGAWVDQLPARRVMVVSDLVAAVTLGQRAGRVAPRRPHAPPPRGRGLLQRRVHRLLPRGLPGAGATGRPARAAGGGLRAVVRHRVGHAGRPVPAWAASSPRRSPRPGASSSTRSASSCRPCACGGSSSAAEPHLTAEVEVAVPRSTHPRGHRLHPPRPDHALLHGDRRAEQLRPHRLRGAARAVPGPRGAPGLGRGRAGDGRRARWAVSSGRPSRRGSRTGSAPPVPCSRSRSWPGRPPCCVPLGAPGAGLVALVAGMLLVGIGVVAGNVIRGAWRNRYVPEHMVGQAGHDDAGDQLRHHAAGRHRGRRDGQHPRGCDRPSR